MRGTTGKLLPFLPLLSSALTGRSRADSKATFTSSLPTSTCTNSTHHRNCRLILCVCTLCETDFLGSQRLGFLDMQCTKYKSRKLSMPMTVQSRCVAAGCKERWQYYLVLPRARQGATGGNMKEEAPITKFSIIAWGSIPDWTLCGVYWARH